MPLSNLIWTFLSNYGDTITPYPPSPYIPSERPYLCNHPPEFLRLKCGDSHYVLQPPPPVDFIVLVLRKGGVLWPYFIVHVLLRDTYLFTLSQPPFHPVYESGFRPVSLWRSLFDHPVPTLWPFLTSHTFPPSLISSLYMYIVYIVYISHQPPHFQPADHWITISSLKLEYNKYTKLKVGLWYLAKYVVYSYSTDQIQEF